MMQQQLAADPTPPDPKAPKTDLAQDLQDALSAAMSDKNKCSQDQESVQQCRIDNIVIQDCHDVVIKCIATRTAKKTCKYPKEIAADAIITIISEKVAQEDQAAVYKALVNALTQAGTISVNPPNDPKNPDVLKEYIGLYIESSCSSVQIANQSVYIPYIVLTGPNCNDVFINAYVTLDQNSACAFARAQNLLRRANLAGGSSTGGGGGAARQNSDLTLGFTPTQFWIGVALIALLVLIGAFFAGWFSRKSNTAA